MNHETEILVDSNVIFSALYKIASIPGLIIYLGILKKIKLLSPESIRDEIIRILKYKLAYSDKEVDFTLNVLDIEWIPKEVYEREIKKFADLLKDYEDKSLLACAVNLNMPIVSGDKDFQRKEVKKLAQIYTPREFIEYLVNSGFLSKREIERLLKELMRLEKLPH